MKKLLLGTLLSLALSGTASAAVWFNVVTFDPTKRDHSFYMKDYRTCEATMIHYSKRDKLNWYSCSSKTLPGARVIIPRREPMGMGGRFRGAH